MRSVFTFILAIILIAGRAFSQETTSTVSGIVTDSKGATVEGASVTVRHEPTGYKTGTQTNSKGIFVIPNLKPGGPYTITVSFVGADDQVFSGINLSL